MNASIKLTDLGLWLVLWCVTALAAHSQTINLDQIRPSTTPGQVVTTVAGTPNTTQWVTPGTGVAVATTSPCTVNGGTGPVSSGTATITCAGANLQMGYTQQGSGQYALVFFTVDGCSSAGGSAVCNPTSYGITISGGATGLADFSVPQLPSGITASQITAIYPFAFKYQLNDIGGGDPTENGPLTFSGTGISGCSPERSGSRNAASTPLQFGCQLTGTLTNFSTITAAMSGSTNFDEGGGTLGSALVGMEIDYTGSPVTTPGTINLGPGFSWDNESDTLSLVDYAIYPLTLLALEGLPQQSNGTYNLVLDATGSSGPCSGSGGGTNTVWCVANGSGGFTAIPFGVTFAGDLNGTPSSQEVVGIHTIPLCNGFSPTNGQIIEYTTSSTPNPCYASVTAPSGSFTAGGDLAGSSTVQQVVGIDSVPLCSGFAPTSGQYLQYTTASSPNPCYEAATPSGGGATVNLAGVVSVSGATLTGNVYTVGTATPTITISSIPSGYNNLLIVMRGSESTGANGLVDAEFNSDAAAHYSWTDSVGNGQNNAGAPAPVGFLSQSSFPGAMELRIFGYTDTTNYPQWKSDSWTIQSFSAGQTIVLTAGYYSGAQAINTIAFTLSDGGNFNTNVTFTIYATN